MNTKGTAEERRRWWGEQRQQQRQQQRERASQRPQPQLSETTINLKYKNILQHVGSEPLDRGAEPEQVALCSGSVAEAFEKVVITSWDVEHQASSVRFGFRCVEMLANTFYPPQLVFTGLHSCERYLETNTILSYLRVRHR